MGKIYKGQALDLVMTVGGNISGSTCVVKFKKPNGDEGSFPTVITDAINGIITASLILSTDLDQVGRWAFWGYVTFGDGTSIPGEVSQHRIYEEGRYIA